MFQYSVWVTVPGAIEDGLKCVGQTTLERQAFALADHEYRRHPEQGIQVFKQTGPDTFIRITDGKSGWCIGKAA